MSDTGIKALFTEIAGTHKQFIHDSFTIYFLIYYFFPAAGTTQVRGHADVVAADVKIDTPSPTPRRPIDESTTTTSKAPVPCNATVDIFGYS
jgi:hypothetical protein